MFYFISNKKSTECSMNRSNYCIKHKRNCFAGGALSSSCHRGNPSSEFDSDTETDRDDSGNEDPDAVIDEGE